MQIALMIYNFASTRVQARKLLFAGYDWKSFRLLISHFWHRLLGTGGIWFCNDWYFYGTLISFRPVYCNKIAVVPFFT